MSRVTAWLGLGLFVAANLTGCAWFDVGPWGGPGYTLQSDKVGSGQQAITTRNDSQYWNGEPMDCRTHR
jgi:hypothetical protein